jgi:hypothetical protein
MMARNIDREGPIQAAIVAFLRLQYPRAYLSSIPNELASRAGGGKDKAARAHTIRNVQAKAKVQGMLPGAPDLIFAHQGRVYGFEVKAEGNRQQPNQKEVQAICEANGITYAVVRSVDDVKEVLTGPIVENGYKDPHAKLIDFRGGI